MILLTVDEVIELHEKLVSRTGGSHGLRDKSLLESAVYSAVSAFGDSEAYPSVEEKAARLMFSLTNNHAFVDGNKIIGIADIVNNKIHLKPLNGLRKNSGNILQKQATINYLIRKTTPDEYYILRSRMENCVVIILNRRRRNPHRIHRRCHHH